MTSALINHTVNTWHHGEKTRPPHMTLSWSMPGNPLDTH